MPNLHVTLHVTLDIEASEAEVRAVAEVFRSVGLDVEVTPGMTRLSADLLPYYVDVVGHSVPFIAAAFATGLAAKAGADSWDAFRDGGWRGLRAFLTGIGRARFQPHGTIQIRAKDYPNIRFTEVIPDEALEALGCLDWGTLSQGRLEWDPETRSWWVLRPGADRPERAERVTPDSSTCG